VLWNYYIERTKTAGTIINPYAESINSRLRSLGFNTDSTKFEIILKLRGYCKFPHMANITLTPVVQQTLETVMKKEVVEIVSNNVLKKQFKQFHLIDASKCRIFSQMENMFSVIEERTIPISNIWNITRSAFATVEWNEEKDKVRCSCNKLVYRGTKQQTPSLGKKKKYQNQELIARGTYSRTHRITGRKEKKRTRNSTRDASQTISAARFLMSHPRRRLLKDLNRIVPDWAQTLS